MSRVFLVAAAVLLCAVACGATCPTPSIAFSQDTAHAGDSLSVDVSGLVPFAPYNFILSRLTLSPLIRSSGNADGEGAATIIVTLPPGRTPPANYTASVACKCEGHTISARAVLEVTANAELDAELVDDLACSPISVSLSSPMVSPGHAFDVQVANAPASASLIIVVVRQGLPVRPLLTAKATADSTGAALASLTIPAGTATANYTVRVSAMCGQTQVYGTQSLLVSQLPSLRFACNSPTLTLSAASVPAGGSLDFSVVNLPASSEVTLRVVKRGLSPLLTISFKSDGLGRVQDTIKIPATAPAGPYAVGASAVCAGSPVIATGSLQITAA